MAGPGYDCRITNATLPKIVLKIGIADTGQNAH